MRMLGGRILRIGSGFGSFLVGFGLVVFAVVDFVV